MERFSCKPFAYSSFLEGFASRDDTSPFSVDDIFIVIGSPQKTVVKNYSVVIEPFLSAEQLRTSLQKAFFGDYLLRLLSNQNTRLQQLNDESEPSEEDESQPTEELPPMDFVTPLKHSLKQILLDTTCVAAQNVLKRVVVQRFSQRAAWKLLKDVPLSALRKSKRGMPFYTYTFCVSRTTFRGQLLTVAAKWLVQVGIECFLCARDMIKTEDEGGNANIVRERGKVLSRRVWYFHRMLCITSLWLDSSWDRCNPLWHSFILTIRLVMHV